MTKTATLKTINTSAFDATGRPGRVRLARAIRIHTRRSERIGARARTRASRPRAVRARAPIGQVSPHTGREYTCVLRLLFLYYMNIVVYYSYT